MPEFVRALENGVRCRREAISWNSIHAGVTSWCDFSSPSAVVVITPRFGSVLRSRKLAQDGRDRWFLDFAMCGRTQRRVQTHVSGVG